MDYKFGVPVRSIYWLQKPTAQHTIRGVVRQNRPIENQTTLAEIFESDKLVITINTGQGQPHQGIVPLQGESLAQALQSYFDQSEQLPTRLWLACNEESTSGLLLQKLPGELSDNDLWNRIQLLSDTVNRDELLTTPADTLLQRLFHQEDYQLFDPSDIQFACTCSNERSENMLKSLGFEEVESILQEQKNISITCEFCNQLYEYDAVDIKQIFIDTPPLPTNQTRH